MNASYTVKMSGADGMELPAWDLSRIPNYDRALPVQTVAAEELSEERFFREFVLQNRPCLIVGAVKHWPAYEKWKSPAYLAAQTDNAAMKARTAPMWEHPPEAAETQRQAREHNRSIFEDVKFHDFLAGGRDSDQFVLHSVPLQPGPPFGKVLADIGGFGFLPKPSQPRMYPAVRAFLYWGSYTDWHFHPSDEALMTQVVGDKEVLLLPPDEQSWNGLYPVGRAQSRAYGVDRARFPKFNDLHPHRVIVGAGDALYIPVYWWHVVATLDRTFGVTVASTFRTPFHLNGDLRFPAARWFLGILWKTRFAPLALAAVAYSYLHRLTSVLHGRGRRRIPPS